MAHNERRTVRKPAMKFAQLRKKMEKAKYRTPSAPKGGNAEQVEDSDGTHDATMPYQR